MADGLAAQVVTAMLLLLVQAHSDGTERAEVLGAVRFGALFAVHGAPAEAKAGARCGPVREHYGIQVLEPSLYTKPDNLSPVAIAARGGHIAGAGRHQCRRRVAGRRGRARTRAGCGASRLVLGAAHGAAPDHRAGARRHRVAASPAPPRRY